MNRLKQPSNIIDRISFIKNMIQTHQSHLMMDNKENREDNRFNPHHSKNKQKNHSCFSKDVSKSYTLSDLSNISFQNTLDSSFLRPKSQPHNRLLKPCKRSKTCSSIHQSTEQSRDSSTSRLRNEELKVMRDLVVIKTQEIQDKGVLVKEKDMHNIQLEQQVHIMQIELNKIGRERDDLKDEVTHLKRKLTKMEQESILITTKEFDMQRDLGEAHQSIQALRAYESELQQKEKNILSDWSLLEREKSTMKEKQNLLIQAERQLSDQVKSIQVLKARVTKQEKMFQYQFQLQKENREKHSQQIKKIDECQKYLDDQEIQIRRRENSVHLKAEEQLQLEGKLMSMQMNEDLWNKKIQSEMHMIESMKSQLKKQYKQ